MQSLRLSRKLANLDEHHVPDFFGFCSAMVGLLCFRPQWVHPASHLHPASRTWLARGSRGDAELKAQITYSANTKGSVHRESERLIKHLGMLPFG